jgi:lipopolysaccharide transport system permease protein
MAVSILETNQEKETESWTEVITPRTNLLDLRLGEVWKYRDLLWLFVKRDFIAQYKQTILGPLWHVIQPLFTTIIFLFLFGRIANIPTDGIKPVLFYMSGITIWNYFAACLTNTSNTFLANANIFGKVYFPRMVLPLSIILSNMVRFGIQFALLLLMMIWFQFHGTPIHFNIHWALLPMLVVLMAGIGLGLGIIISSLTTKYRDLVILLGFAVQLGMYATPIAYPLSFLQNTGYAKIISANPLSPVVECFRYCLFGKGTFNLYSLAYSVVFMIVVLFLGAIIFNKVEKSFMDTV